MDPSHLLLSRSVASERTFVRPLGANEASHKRKRYTNYQQVLLTLANGLIRLGIQVKARYEPEVLYYTRREYTLVHSTE
ncbi:MAG: hypothetical protein AAF702_24985 [Chloroflexota bacterium]